ncbi:GGDEF domain-containing protein [Alteromonas pelagimontana]|uniref:diguanylate cyclase n=1 Tax=Alteromonas pelagimontana TaxID=1858656 RepID=A0A6M4MBE4_9ALTE|nr:GGDEF domain-containing protein [Alteromonas pelagimontana]QJR79476.1 GGDEF domain-containing protein [Alteromonas pelagimontana]
MFLAYRVSRLIWLSLGSLAVAVGLSLLQGEAKPTAIISWLDVTGEGSVAVFSLLWITALLASRPPGRVTTLMLIGLNCFLFSATLDLLDEFYQYPISADWLGMVESIPAAFGMVVMSVALYLWHQEQLALGRQLQRREMSVRQHDLIDPITQLYRAEYWREQAKSCQVSGIDAFVAVVDINHFSQFNQRYGHHEGDRFLREIAQLLIMHVRAVDLVCRYAGDRFVLLLPQISLPEANELCFQLRLSIHHIAFRTGRQTTAIFQSARSVTALLSADTCLDSLLQRLNRQLDEAQRDVA